MNLPAKPLPDDYKGMATEAALNGVKAMQEGEGMKGFKGVLGDVEKGVKAIFDVVEGVGWAEDVKGGEKWLRLPLGRDGSERWEVKLKALRDNLDGTEGIWSKTGEGDD